MIIILDTTLLTLLTKESKPPRYSDPLRNEYKCKNWLLKMKVRGARIFVPEICIYELSRYLLLAENNYKIGQKNDNFINGF